MKLVIEYIQCYWQSFALGMGVMFLWQHFREKRHGDSQRHHGRPNTNKAR